MQGDKGKKWLGRLYNAGPEGKDCPMRLQVKEPRYFQARGQQEGAGEINTQLSLALFPFIFFHGPFITASHWLKVSRNQRAREPDSPEVQLPRGTEQSRAENRGISPISQAIELAFRRCKQSLSDPKTNVIQLWECLLNHLLDPFVSHSLSPDISTKFTRLCSHLSASLLVSTLKETQTFS